ncbi:MAG: tryptophan--tRNA ligase [Candidatus Pacebacteria bacterium]|nr:tryptophan--tRNA ligase [Candidatus Paceibacterota bacterium]
MKKILLSGVKPTGRPHLGNYFGAMKQWVDLQNDYEMYVMIADYHALNLIQNKDEMLSQTEEMIKDYLAIGLDPEKVTFFKQSDISAHTELTWIFDTITTVPYLMRAHAYKDKEGDVSVGTFNYPVLMAADILLYDTDVVPVGQDQKQHIEITRDTAQKFNGTFSEIFKLPEELIVKDVAVVPGTDGRKMSKSYKNTIPLFATYEEIQKAVMSIVTDSGGDIPKNVYEIHRLFGNVDQFYEENKGKYKVLKEKLIEDIEAFIKPLRERRQKVSVEGVLEKGKIRAKDRADKKLEIVKKAIGVLK